MHNKDSAACLHIEEINIWKKLIIQNYMETFGASMYQQ